MTLFSISKVLVTPGQRCYEAAQQLTSESGRKPWNRLTEQRKSDWEQVVAVVNEVRYRGRNKLVSLKKPAQPHRNLGWPRSQAAFRTKS